MKKTKEPSELDKARNLIVAETIKLFEPINLGVAKLYGNKTERKWALHLHNKYGKEKVLKMIEFIPTYNKGLKTKWGKVLKPSQLVEHLQDVIDAKVRLDNKLLHEIEVEREEKRKRQEDLELKKQRDSYTLEQKEELKRKSDAIRRTILGF